MIQLLTYNFKKLLVEYGMTFWKVYLNGKKYGI